MRIGIMLRHLGQHGGGVKVYTANLLRELLALDTPHEFVMLHRDARYAGRHADGERVREVVLDAPSVLWWDQVTVARAARREGLEVVFNPKYSIPLHTRAATAFVCHGLDWFVAPEWSRWRDRLSHRLLVPRYARAADVIVAVSDATRRDLIRFLDVDDERVRTVHHGVDDVFRGPVAAAEIDRLRTRFDLPPRFFLFCGQIYPPKNFGRVIRAFARVRGTCELPLVVAGAHTWLCEDEIALIDSLGLADHVHRLGWVSRPDLPALYALAEALVMPSLYESFGLPLLEAMAAGCPVVTSDRGAIPEIVADAALIVDPEDVESIGEGMRRIVEDRELRSRLADRGRERAADFSWARCARETLRALEGLAAAA